MFRPLSTHVSSDSRWRPRPMPLLLAKKAASLHKRPLHCQVSKQRCRTGQYWSRLNSISTIAIFDHSFFFANAMVANEPDNEDIKDAVAAYDLMPPPSKTYTPASMARKAKRKKKELRQLQKMWARFCCLQEVRSRIAMRVGSDPTTWRVDWNITLRRLGWDTKRQLGW